MTKETYQKLFIETATKIQCEYIKKSAVINVDRYIDDALYIADRLIHDAMCYMEERDTFRTLEQDMLNMVARREYSGAEQMFT